MQDVEQLSQTSENLSQELEQLSQVYESDIQWMDMEAFANATGKTQQGISYLINKGRLKEYRDEGIRIKKTDKWYIDAALVALVRTEKPLKTVGEKEALNNQLRSTQTALIKYREFEKRIETLEEDKTKLLEQIDALQQLTEDKLQALKEEKESLAQVVQELSQELQDSTAQKIQHLQTEKDNLSQLVQQLVQDLDKIKSKPWWQFW